MTAELVHQRSPSCTSNYTGIMINIPEFFSHQRSPSCISNYIGIMINISESFLIPNTSGYSIKYFFLFASCNQNYIQYFVLSLLSHLWTNWCGGGSHIVAAKWEDMRLYYSDFPWNDCCFRVRGLFVCALRKTEAIVPSKEANILHTFSNIKTRNSWFNKNYSHAIKER